MSSTPPPPPASRPTPRARSRPLTWLHFGDLHASADDGFASLATFEALVAEANAHLGPPTVDFAFLPGDNANHGAPAQYRRIRAALGRLRLPVHVIPGDHDYESHSLDAFYDGLGGRRLPYAVTVRGRRCLFLDVVSAGGGGPDLRLGARQHRWVERQLDTATADRRRPVVFLHAFPGDLARGRQALARLFARHRVPLVSTGHTHYNELLNDGAVVYAAARSTGQIEEGPPGFALGAVDGVAPSWRFKPLDSPWPFVLITAPVDARLATRPATRPAGRSRRGPRPGDGDTSRRVRATVFGASVAAVCLVLDDGPPTPMRRDAHAPARWTATLPPLGDGAHVVVVEACGPDGVIDRDAITVDDTGAARRSLGGTRGDHRHRVGAWPEHGVLGTRLGPNANGRAW